MSMSEITLGQLQNLMLWAIGFVGAIITMVKAVKVAVEKGYQPILERIDKVDKNGTMNYIVSQLDSIEKGEKLDGVARKRLYEQYEHYTADLKGNTYIHDEFERLKKDGKL